MAATRQLQPGADRYFGPGRDRARVARKLFESVVALPLVCPHTHVDANMFSVSNYSFGTPAALFIVPDHYVYRMLYSQGVPMQELGVPERTEGTESGRRDDRRIWQTFAEQFHLFRGTPTGQWIGYALREVFGVEEKLNGHSAQQIYDHISAALMRPEFQPRALYEKFNIEVLCTTDAATDSLEHHAAIAASDWGQAVRPTFRPDSVVNLETPGWREHVARLSAATGIDIVGYESLILALEDRRTFFRQLGATATDHACATAFTAELSMADAEAIVRRALKNELETDDATRFTGHMLIEMARMSREDGLVMQLHVGALRDHNSLVFDRFGRDKGADIPIAGEYTRNLRPLLNKHGNDPRLTLVLFTLDESTHGRELAPLAGHYPALKLGAPWWFFDSAGGVYRYLDCVVGIAGLYNTAGFNDDARTFCSIPARHDMWRRVTANWLAGLVLTDQAEWDEAVEMMRDMAYGLAKATYRL